jgi:general stress protein 26
MAQQEKQMSDLVKTMEGIRVAMMATVGDDGRLESRPMAVMQIDDDGTLWFLTKDGTHKLEHLRHVNLGFADRDDANYVSVCGSGTVVHDRETIERIWGPMAKPWFPEGPDDPTMVALKIEPETIEYWDTSSSRMVRLLEMARAAATGTRFRKAEHGRVDVK